jgi:hypothetical protein
MAAKAKKKPAVVASHAASEPQTGKTPPVWEVVSEIGKKVPLREWRKVPSDLSKNLDHYLYGAPKADE